jgi:hypothetical protein
MRRHDRHSDAIDQAFDRLLHAALAEYSDKQKLFGQRLERLPKWNLDLSGCTLSFSGEGQAAEMHSITPIATYLPTKRSWLWAWANDGIPATARDKSSRLKGLTEKTQYRVFTTPTFEASLDEVDELCALALQELAARAVFKSKEDEPWLFVSID